MILNLEIGFEFGCDCKRYDMVVFLFVFFLFDGEYERYSFLEKILYERIGYFFI